MRSPSERRPWRALALALIGAALLVTGALPAWAAEISASSTIIVRDGDIRRDDLYAGAINIIVLGTVEGDLFAFAAEEITISGTVTGSVVAIAPTVIVEGQIGQSLRAVTSDLRVDGEVGRDVVVTAWSVGLGEGASVAGDVFAWAVSMTTQGQVGGDLGGTQRSLSLGGAVAGNVDVSVSSLTVVEDLAVTGDLVYRSEAEAVGLEQAAVDGVVVRRTPLPPNIRIRALALFGRFTALVLLTGAALSVAYAWPRRTAAAIEQAVATPVRAWWHGAAVMASPLVIAAVGGVTLALAPPAASLPLLALFLPVVLALIGLVAALSLVAGIPAVGWLGGVLFKRLELYGALLGGSLVAGMAWVIPVIGWLVPLVVLPLGLGAWRLSLLAPEGSPESSPLAPDS